MNKDQAGSLYCRAKEIPDRYPDLFTHRQWEWVMRNRDTNGVQKAVRRLGSSLFINVDVLLQVLEESHEG